MGGGERGGQCHTPATLPLDTRPGTHCTGGWVGPRAGLDGWGKSCPSQEVQPLLTTIFAQFRWKEITSVQDHTIKYAP